MNLGIFGAHKTQAAAPPQKKADAAPAGPAPGGPKMKVLTQDTVQFAGNKKHHK
jgi:hypothetical protein